MLPPPDGTLISIPKLLQHMPVAGNSLGALMVTSGGITGWGMGSVYLHVDCSLWTVSFVGAGASSIWVITEFLTPGTRQMITIC